MKEHRDLKFANHPSMSSKHIKFLCHNSSFELVESTQAKLKSLETDFKNHKSKFITLIKSSNTAMQRADEAKKGLADLTKVVTKIENKK